MTNSGLAAASIFVGVLVFGIKLVASWLSGSVALYADALESVVNVVAALLAFAAIRWAAKPADGNHPYGHDKAEYLSAVAEGVLVVLAALAIFDAAARAFGQGQAEPVSWAALATNLAATGINAFWGRKLLREGAARRSPALTADGRHLWADVVSSLGVVAGLILAIMTGVWWLDPLLAVAVAGTVLWSGWRLVIASVGGLMDAAAEPVVLETIQRIIAAQADGAIQAHDLRTRTAGRRTFLEFHLVVPGALSVEAAHDICDRIEAALRDALEEAVITIHVEPERKAKHSGVVLF